MNERKKKDGDVTLRDYFAAHALSYLGATAVAHQQQWAREGLADWEDSSIPDIARDAYRIADEMLARREEG